MTVKQSYNNYFNWAFLFVAGTVFIWRAPLTALSRNWDYAWNYLSARVWLSGQNPYSYEASLGVRPEDFPTDQFLQGIVTPYPPAIFPIISPLVLADWGTSIILFMLLNLLLLSIAFIVSMNHFNLKGPPALLFLGLFMFSYPMHTGISLGQFSVASIACLIVSWCMAPHKFRKIVVVLFGALSVIFKPQIGIILCGIFIYEKRWSELLQVALVYVLVSILSLSVIFYHGADLDDFGDLLASVVSIYGQQTMETCCVNLRMLTRNLDVPEMLKIFIDVATVAALSLLTVSAAKNKVLPRIYCYLVMYTIFLLVTYHRPYDLAGLILLAAWFLWKKDRQPLDYLALASVSIIFQPIPTTAALSKIKEFYPQLASELGPIWNWVLIPHTTWLLLIFWITLIIMIYKFKEPSIGVTDILNSD